MTKTPSAQEASAFARELIDAEIAKQDAMWGDMNERADVSNGQLLAAGIAQAHAVRLASENPEMRAEMFLDAQEAFYPQDWSGFRDYGSDIANLVVAAAYIHNEIKRRLLMGESHYRAPRRADQPYNPETGLPKAVA